MSQEYVLKLYVNGSNLSSELALRRLEEIISQSTEFNIKLEIIDVREHPQLAEDDQILAVPTLVKKLPLPVRKIIGDLSSKDKVLLGLNIVLRTKIAL